MKLLKRALLVIGVIAAIFVITPTLAWLSIPPYHHEFGFSENPLDGQGEASIYPSRWETATDDNELEIEYCVGEDGIKRGGGIRVNFGHVLEYGGKPHMYIPFSITAVSAIFFDINLFRAARVESDSKASLKVIMPSTRKAFTKLIGLIKYKRTAGGKNTPDNYLRTIDKEHALEIKVVNGELKPGETVSIRLGDKKADKGLRAPHRGNVFQVIVQTDGDGDSTYRPVEELPALEIISKNTRQLEVITPSTSEPGSTFKVIVKAMDDHFLPNVTPTYVGTVSFEYPPQIDGPRAYTFTPDDAGLHTFDFRASAPGIYRIGVRDDRGLEALSNPIDTRPAGKEITWGDIHVHSILSYDADREPEYVFYRQRYVEGHGFTCLSDHDHIGGLPFVERRGYRGMTEAEWKYIGELSEKYNDPGRFVTLGGYEWTSYNKGHRNVYYAPSVKEIPLYLHTNPAYNTPAKLYEALRDVDCLVIPHSTAWRTSENKYDWGPEFDKQRSVEIYSTHGASEYCDNPYAVHKGHKEAPTDSELVKNLMNYNIRQATADSGNFVQDALAAGWKFGFIGCGDLHYLAYIDQAYKWGITGAFVNDVTREDVFSALRNRETYATTNCRMIIRFDFRDHPMGSECDIPRGEEPVFRAEVIGTGEISLIELVKYDGKSYLIAAEALPDADYYSGAFVDESFADHAFYYLRVTQEDGNMGWASPIWLQETRD